MNINTAEVLHRGMSCLLEKMNVIEAEQFIFLALILHTIQQLLKAVPFVIMARHTSAILTLSEIQPLQIKVRFIIARIYISKILILPITQQLWAVRLRATECSTSVVPTLLITPLTMPVAQLTPGHGNMKIIPIM